MENTENKKIFIAGCGGLGCYIVENLVRLNISSITVCDGDSFSESNLNRQLYATQNTLGKKKVLCAKERAAELGYIGKFTALDIFLDESNAEELIADSDIVIDALDNTKTRFILEDACAKKCIPLIHGAVGEWNYQLAVVMPGSNLMHILFAGEDKKNNIPTYPFTVQACAAAQSAEALKILKGEPSELINALLLADLKHNTYETININSDCAQD